MENKESYDAAHTISTSRLLPHNMEQVFSAFEDPEILARWWGPDGFTNTFHQFNFIEGGEWNFTMHSADGHSFECHHRFVELVKPRKFVFDHIQDGHNFQGIFILTDEDGQTQLSFTMMFEDAEECASIRAFVEPANEQNLNRLQAILQGTV